MIRLEMFFSAGRNITTLHFLGIRIRFLGNSSDVKLLICHERTNEVAEAIFAHKFVLSASSTKLCKMLEQSNNSKVTIFREVIQLLGNSSYFCNSRAKGPS